MNSKLTPLQQAAELLQELPILRVKLGRALFCSPADCQKVLSEVIKFLTLAAECTGEQITPSARVDLAWHEFILFTRSYSKFCEQNYGKMIHHEPSDDRHKNSRQYVETLRRYRNRFGPPPHEYWVVDWQLSDHADPGVQGNASGRTAHCGNCESES